MESVNVLKGYGKLGSPEAQTPHHHRAAKRPLIVALTISSVVLLTISLGFLVGALIRESNAEESESRSLRSSSAQSIRAVCSVTQHQDSCFASISSLNSSVKPDPEAIFELSLRVCVNEVSNASLFVRNLVKSSNDARSKGALGDCAGLLEDAAGRLADSVAAMAGPGEDKAALTELKISNIQTWVTAAMTDQETCLDGLQEMGSTVLDEIRDRLSRSREFMSNSLAICAQMNAILDRFEMGMH
ncbi:hypothetical protein BT93_B0230 [Corymbia citriodora subsp. variegata]|nr:hypothetical protein BT93_B0230 [Corymbia citriodora subsp. variegata]